MVSLGAAMPLLQAENTSPFVNINPRLIDTLKETKIFKADAIKMG